MRTVLIPLLLTLGACATLRPGLPASVPPPVALTHPDELVELVKQPDGSQALTDVEASYLRFGAALTNCNIDRKAGAAAWGPR